MTVADVAAIAGLVVDIVALFFLVNIWKDDKAMRAMAEESLDAQREYLGLRRKWYESRTKKKADEKADVRPVDGSHTHDL